MAEASLRDFPSSVWRKMFSMTTMASSIRMPTDKERANMVIMLSEKPSISMTKKVPMIEVGMATAEMSVVLRFRRKKKMTRTARPPPKIRWNLTSLMFSSM